MMKKRIGVLVVALTAIWSVYHFTGRAADSTGFQTFEFASIRWGGRDNTHVIRPSGKVEFLGPLLNRIQRPDRTDERAFYMSIAMNALAKEGYEFAGMTGDEIVMKRPAAK